jgi:hypothetical protein
VNKLLIVALTFAALLVSGCGDQVLLNRDCKHDCFTLDNIENQDEATIQQRLKAACEGKGAPKINERRKTVIAAQCGE